MKKYSFLFILHILTVAILMAQQPAGKKDNYPPKVYRHAAGFGLYLPVGTFTESHLAGAGADYTWSYNKYGNNLSYKRPLGLIATGGINFFYGKKIKTAGYDYRYGNYLNLYVMPGITYILFTKASASLAAGPVLNIYKATTSASLGVTLQTNYSVSKNISMGPGLVFRKRTNTDALWALALRASYSF